MWHLRCTYVGPRCTTPSRSAFPLGWYDDLDDLVGRRWLAVILDLDLLRLEQPVHGGFERLAAVLVLARELCCGVLPGEQRRRVAWTDLVADEALLLGVAARASFRPRANAPLDFTPANNGEGNRDAGKFARVFFWGLRVATAPASPILLRR